MFFFLEHIGRPTGLSLQTIAKQYDDTYGLSSKLQQDSLQEFCKNVHKIDNWSQYFAAIGLPCPTEHELVQHLLKALENSKSKSYHSEINNQLRKRCWKFTKLGYCTKGNKCPFYHADKYAQQASPSQVT